MAEVEITYEFPGWPRPRGRLSRDRRPRGDRRPARQPGPRDRRAGEEALDPRHPAERRVEKATRQAWFVGYESKESMDIATVEKDLLAVLRCIPWLTSHSREAQS